MFYVRTCFLMFLVGFFANAQKNYVDKINPLMGTNNSFLLSHGNTLPLVGRPFGMTYWTPQSAPDGMFMYNYQDTMLYGLRATHLPSPWMGDFGSFNLMAHCGDIKAKVKQRASRFSHGSEKASPHNYAVRLLNSTIDVNMTATERCGYIQFTFPASKQSTVYLDIMKGGTSFTINRKENKITGFAKNNSGGTPANFACYFVVVFNKTFKSFGLIKNDSIFANTTSTTTDEASAYVQFETTKGEKISAKIATSFISVAQAELNLLQEIGNKPFGQIQKESFNVWNNEMSKIEVEGGTDEQQKVFYSCFYRTLLFPTKFYELDAENSKIYYSPYDGKLHKGVMYTNNGLWDTYRAAFPFFTIIQPKVHSEFCQSMVNAYKEGGWLPRWMSPGYREIMVGVHAASLFADGYSKGLRDFDAQTALEGMLKDAYEVNPITIRNKEGLENYNQKGYVLSTVRESVAKNLEYAYTDYCGYVFANALNRSNEADAFLKRSFNYKNTFDGSVGLMRGKDIQGRWRTPFDPFAWGGDFTEGSAWHYVWSVFHDPAGLIDLMGGKNKMVLKMDSIFTLPPLASFSYYGWKIHEIVEMENGNMGQYAHGNQPIQHFIYLYNYAGQPWKTQFWARNIMNKLYNSTENGYCGDEDNGQTSAWFVMGAMGFYSVCPGSTQYVIGSPMFKKTTLHLPNNKTFVIDAESNSDKNIFIQKATLNGKAFNKTYFTHAELINGGNLTFEMDEKPSSTWGQAVNAVPFSLSQNPFCSPPYLIGKSGIIEAETQVVLASLTDGETITYTLDGTEPTLTSTKFSNSLKISKTATLKAKAFKVGFEPSLTFETAFDYEFMEPIGNPETKPALSYQYYEGNWESLPDFEKLTAKKKGNIPTFTISPKERDDMYAISYDGFIEIPANGIYTFYFKSDDGLKFYLNNQLLHQVLGRHGMEEYNETVKLKKGMYKLRAEFNEIDGGEGLTISIESKNIPKQEIPAQMLSHKK